MNGNQATYQVAPQAEKRNRWTVGFRFILAIPHELLVGGPGFDFNAGIHQGNGALGLVAGICSFINWFIIVFTGKANADLIKLSEFYLRWRARALAYEAILRDEYPPFGDGDYPVEATFPSVLEGRNRWTVGFRFILIIPQAIVLFFVVIAWIITSIIGWFAVLFTGHYPDGLWKFAEGTMRWTLRVNSYWLLLHDDYPPFSLE
jgi:hypothetical protein